MSYETLRYFADTWGLLFLFLVFVAVVGWVFRPGTRKKYEKNAKIPLSEDK
ncbi:MAG: cbb3-type cytochrome c oxidase subunit 3 [Fimbriimonadaceae bacterium]|nr:cbb3-type cytochrome c oxidase subunit 3 [Alphaproteobacteria bacterium]